MFNYKNPQNLKILKSAYTKKVHENKCNYKIVIFRVQIAMVVIDIFKSNPYVL